MKKFIKACLVAVLVFVIVGIVLLVVAAAGGVTRASLRLFSNQGNLSYGPVRVHIGDGFSVDLAGNLNDNQSGKNISDYALNVEGETILKENGVYALNQEVKELYVDVDAGDFTLLQSEDDYFYIESTDDKIRVNYENGRLEIECIDSIDLIQIGVHRVEDVTIYVPAGLEFDTVSIDVDAGNVDVNMPLTTKWMELDVDAGSITIDSDMEAQFLEMNVDIGNFEAYDELVIINQLDMNVGAGNIFIDQLDCYGIMEAQCDAGNMEINGHLYNDMTVMCDVGDVTMDLIGTGNNYTYEIESSVAGNVTVNGNSYSGLGNDIILPGEGGDAPTVKISCDVGNVEIDIR